jgi:hypothetical protein
MDPPQLKESLGSTIDVTVFRQLKPKDHFLTASVTLCCAKVLASMQMDDGCNIRCSRCGTLLNIAERLVNRSDAGYCSKELGEALHVDVQDSL